MTRQKKIQRDKQIEAYLYLFIVRAGCFDWWLDDWLFQQVAYTIPCSIHRVKRVFYKNVLEENYSWLEQFTY